MARYSQQLLKLFDLPGGLVVDDIGRAAAHRLVKFHVSVGNRSRDTFIFPRTTHQVVVFVVEGREYVVTIFVGFNTATVERQRTDMSWNGPSPDIAGDSSLVNDGPRANSAIDFCHGVTYIVATQANDDVGENGDRL